MCSFMNESVQIVISILWGVAIGGIAWYCASVSQKITYTTLADGRKLVRVLPWTFRVLLPFIPNVSHIFDSPRFEKVKEIISRRLTAAGFEGLLQSGEFLGLRLLMPVVFGIVWIIGMIGLLAILRLRFLNEMAVPLCLMGPLWFYAYPGIWLRKALRIRHRSIQKALPFVLDLLTLTVEAGTDFMTGLQRSIEKRKLDPLGEELIRVVREIQLGKTRREALRDMAERVDMPDMRTVVYALVQADELGVSIGAMLRIQADQMRQRRFERAEKLANEAPVKLLFPLVFLIFPAVFLVLLGPVLFSVLREGL